MTELNESYFERREKAALELAAQAAHPGIRRIHLTMAAEYRRRADAEGEKPLLRWSEKPSQPVVKLRG